MNMKYVAYKLSFQTGVHFGKGMLNETRQNFPADMLYSALCTEALRMDCLEKFYQLTVSGNIVFSDSFPFIKDTLYIPKPMVKLEHGDEVSDRKKWKKLNYVPIHRLKEYLEGNLDVDAESALLGDLGSAQTYQKVSLVNTEKSEPYTVGVYHFHEGNGLYVLMGYKAKEDRVFIEQLMHSLGYQGIGGKVSTGLGKFTMLAVELSDSVTTRLEKEEGTFVLLTTSLPTDTELESVIRDANYLLEKRSGFVQSANYADEPVKKQDIYFLKSGSVVGTRFQGDIYNIGRKGTHPVWRYAKPMFMEVSI